MGRFMLKQLHIKQWRINPGTRCKVMFNFGLILETLWNNCENNSWHKASSLWCTSRQLRPLQASRGPRLWQKTECRQLLWWLFQGLTGCMTQIRTEKIIASNGYTSLVNGMLKRAQAEDWECYFAGCCQILFWTLDWGLKLLLRASVTHLTDHYKSQPSSSAWCCYSSMSHED